MIKRLRRLSISILLKITVPYVFLALLIALGGTYLVTSVVVDSVEERFTNQLIEAGLLANESLVRIERDLLEDMRLISYLGGMAEGVQNRQLDILTQLSLPVAYSADIQAFAIVDRARRTLVALRFDAEEQIYVPLESVDGLGGLDFVEAVLAGMIDEQGDKFSGFVQGEESEYLFIAGAIENAEGEIVGAAMVGSPISRLAQIVREETLAQVTLYSLDGQPLVSTFGEAVLLDGAQAAEVVARQNEGSLARDIEDSAINYRELLTVWEMRGQQDVGVLGIALPSTFIAQANQVTRTNVLLLMAVAMVLVVLIGMVVAGRITRPIHALRDAAAQVAGGDLGVKVAPTTRDELSVLTLSFNEMVNSLRQSKRDQLDTYDSTIEGWARALDLRDHETEGHSRRVTAITVELAKEMGMNETELEHIRRGALLHDIGKIAVPDSVLLKPGSLTPKERELINQHPNYARQFMEQVKFLAPALAIPYSHHEHWDGTGYPQGLEGEAIPLAARIFAVVDVWDALTNDRPYRDALSRKKARKILVKERGKHFDPEVLDVFLDLIDERDW